MDNEKLKKANSLSEQIKKIKERIKDIDHLTTKSIREPGYCKLENYNYSVHVDQDLFEIALICQEKRLNKKLINMEDEFNKF